MTPTSIFAAAAVVMAVAAARPPAAFGQAWLPMKGDGSISTGVQVLHVNWHLEHDGSRQEESNVLIRNVAADFTYGLTNRIAIAVGLPLVASKWGELSHPCPEPVVSETGAFLYLPCAVAENADIDDGRYHAAFQDFRANVRYGLWYRHVTLTPFVGVVLPSHTYEIHGHTAPGRRLREVQLGFHAGRSLSPKLPDTYVHATYGYTIAQRVRHHDLDLGLNRSNTELEVGHDLNARLSVAGLLSWQHAHGGLEWVDELFTSDHEEIHDRAARASYRRGGVSLSLAVTSTTTINCSVFRTFAGRNSHKLDGFAIGTTWSFTRGGPLFGGGKN